MRNAKHHQNGHDAPNSERQSHRVSGPSFQLVHRSPRGCQGAPAQRRPNLEHQRLASILPRRGGLRHKGPRATSTAADPRPAPPSGGRAASLRPCLVGPPVSGNTVHGRLRTAILLASSSPESSSPAPEGQPPAIESPTPEQDLGKFGQTPASLILTLLHRHIEMKENELRKFGQEPPIGGVEKPDHEQNVCGLIDPANSKSTVSGRFQK